MNAVSIRDMVREQSSEFRKWMDEHGRKAMQETRLWLQENAPRIYSESREAVRDIQKRRMSNGKS